MSAWKHSHKRRGNVTTHLSIVRLKTIFPFRFSLLLLSRLYDTKRSKRDTEDRMWPRGPIADQPSPLARPRSPYDTFRLTRMAQPLVGL